MLYTALADAANKPQASRRAWYYFCLGSVGVRFWSFWKSFGGAAESAMGADSTMLEVNSATPKRRSEDGLVIRYGVEEFWTEGTCGAKSWRNSAEGGERSDIQGLTLAPELDIKVQQEAWSYQQP